MKSFSSEWFGEMVDSAVKRVVGESEQVLPCCGEEQPTPLQPLIFNSDTHHPMNENHSESDLNFDNLDFNEIFGDEDNANDQQCDHNLEKVTKRMRKLPAIFKSPYLIQYSHLVDEEEDDKICILEYALSAKLPKDEELYDDGSTFLNREYCLSLGSDGHIFGELIDAWCHILNSRNKLNRKEKRIFFPNAAFNLLCMNDYYGECTQKDTIEFRQSKFFETLDFTMYENKIDTIKGFNLVFFIVHAWSHFYVMCINMKAKTLDILDNRILEDGIPLESKYRDYPRKVLEAFSLFLHRAEYKCYRHVAKFKIRLIEMPWRSNMNTVDCGVYAMRHMETYHAQNNWDCGLYSDNFEGLKKLRIQYCIDLLTDNANDKRVELQVLARKFKKLENNE
ncbi:uncharacterized protein LOC125495428 isoform X2 [Beta vulgaris subsp. vulgaris]|uniref:uncharacterized protein LOC125495428 isoform X2 n=1 Tax=Beta vulgaris subsp. vulgaris TaxID=3555 RepID=UPI0025489F6A|nr:uncharacterized protein LOC125495428 isoform X2 [Beta vulgaris subsp. vulgaris]